MIISRADVSFATFMLTEALRKHCVFNFFSYQPRNVLLPTAFEMVAIDLLITVAIKTLLLMAYFCMILDITLSILILFLTKVSPKTLY